MFGKIPAEGPDSAAAYFENHSHRGPPPQVAGAWVYLADILTIISNQFKAKSAG